MIRQGDAIQCGPQPASGVGRLHDLACPVVISDTDAALVTGEETRDAGIISEQTDVVQSFSECHSDQQITLILREVCVGTIQGAPLMTLRLVAA